jgi:DNA-binding NarL/FixJ family response regulator
MRSTTKGETGPGTRSTPAHILIADDHELVRDGFRHMLGYEEDLKAVGEASNGREVVELCRRLKPDLVLMDVCMPEINGLEATRVIKAEQPEVRVLVVSTYSNPDYLLEAIEAGASGYILKDAPNRQLTNAMRRVLDGESPLGAGSVAGQALLLESARARLSRLKYLWVDTPGFNSKTSQPGELPPAPLSAAASTPILEKMTSRELEVLRLLAQGKTNQDIAEDLLISRSTVKAHVQHIIAKLEVSNRTQAVVRVFELGLVCPPQARP